MLKKLFPIFLSLASAAHASPSPVLWGSPYSVDLQNGLCLTISGPCTVYGTQNPTSTATAGNLGSLFISSFGNVGQLYIKQDNGTSTNWSLIPAGASGFLKADGSTQLTADWGAGSHAITTNSVVVGSAANAISGVQTIDTGSSSNLVLKTNGNIGLTINSSQNTCVGASCLSTKFGVGDSSFNIASFNGSNASGMNVIFENAAGAGGFIGTPSNAAGSAFTFQPTSGDAMSLLGGTSGTVGISATGVVNISTLTASQAVFTDGSKNLVSNAVTGTGSVVRSASPTLTGTIAGASETLTGTLTVSSQATFSLGGGPFEEVLQPVGGSGTPGTELLQLAADTTHYNWFVGAQNNVNQGWEVTPSAGLSGSGSATTFSTPILKVTNVSGVPAVGVVGAFSATSTVTLSGITTGTNADFLCLSAGGVVLLQSSSCTISSARFKENIEDVEESSGLNELMQLRPVDFNMKKTSPANPDLANATRTQLGLIAEEVAKVDPRLAIYEQDGKTPKSYRQEAVISVLIKAVQQQQAEIEALKKEIASR